MLLVTSVGIFFAVMSSAFILQARAVRTCPAVSNAHELHAEPVARDAYTTPTDIAVEVRAAADGLTAAGVNQDRPVTECGRPSYRENADGSVSVYFEVCPDDATIDLASQGVGEPRLEVRRIHR